MKARLRHPARLLLALLVGTSTAGTGCAGLRRLVSNDCPRPLRQVEILKPAPGAQGDAVDAATCRRSCMRPGLEYERVTCLPCGVEFEHPTSRFIHCRRQQLPDEFWRPVTDEALAAAVAERDAIQERRRDDAESLTRRAELYGRLCGAGPGAFNPIYDTWSASTAPPPAPPAERFVVCDVVVRRACPSPF
jgi:hypothetical protein